MISGRTPVASGSSVPRCPTRRVPAILRMRLTTSCDVQPCGLSTTMTPATHSYFSENESVQCSFWPRTLRDAVKFCPRRESCLLYTSDAADDLLCVDLGGRRIIKKK